MMNPHEAPEAVHEAHQRTLDSLRRMMIVSAHTKVRMTALSGGVSSDIVRVELPSGVLCVKRALPKLRVAADWRAPIERNRYEVAWMRVATAVVPNAVPQVLGDDPEGGAFAMEWLAPEHFPVWKVQLASGGVEPATAAAVGDVLGRIHRATAGNADIARQFATDDIFYAIRLEPHLVATAHSHPALAERLLSIARVTAETRRALVHGDFSPKNLLIGPRGPVVLDAECAWYGDPAFDLAFIENHLLLKGAWRPQWRARYAEAFDSLTAAYFAHVDWEPREALAARVAALLPALMLARIDGKSPVEYLDEPSRVRVREFALAALERPVSTPGEIAARWANAGRTR